MRQRQPSQRNHHVHKRHHALRTSCHTKIPRPRQVSKPETTITTTTTTTTTTTATTSNLETDPATATSPQAVAAKLRDLQRLSHDLSTMRTKYEPIVLRTSLEITEGRVKPGAQNQTYLEYEDLLLKKLTELDAVASEGSEVVRMRRKELVNKCQEMLGVLDQYRVRQMESRGGRGEELGGTIKQVESSEKTSSNIGDEETTKPSEMMEFAENTTGLEEEEPEIDESPTTHESDEEMESLCSDTEDLEDETENESHDDQSDQDEGYYKSYHKSYHVPRRSASYRRARPTYLTRVRDSFFPRGGSFLAWDRWPRSAFGEAVSLHYLF
ncbi:hypothetical protein BC937DRAFT_91091 [Endogone sp. FLAS-F59071]|nr:hypothetical protein BC937DRAFT_91091 [Endogone sp. FLAS-F59071]|eukprot:RUS16544.1 hypothetical protein BC937DRAFT_91091 [Endogone sp. FLAS-F59071]